jgi:hypothetical protein
MQRQIPTTLLAAGVLCCAQAVAAEPVPASESVPTQQPVQPPAQPPIQPRPAAGDTRASPPAEPVTFDFAGLRMTQSRGDNAYLLDIELGDLPADQVMVRPAGGGLLISVRRTSEASREEVLEDGRGYRRSWGYSSGQRSQRLPAPPDADLRAMRRVDEAGAIHISIPRFAGVPDFGAMPPMPPYGRPGNGPTLESSPESGH